MIKIVVGGALSKNEIAEIITKCGGDRVEVAIEGDLQAAMGLKGGKYDYYFGACATGSGGALSMAIAMNGMDKCISVAMVGRVLDDAEIRQAVKDGKIAFGFVSDAAPHVIPVIMEEILAK